MKEIGCFSKLKYFLSYKKPQTISGTCAAPYKLMEPHCLILRPSMFIIRATAESTSARKDAEARKNIDILCAAGLSHREAAHRGRPGGRPAIRADPPSWRSSASASEGTGRGSWSWRRWRTPGRSPAVAGTRRCGGSRGDGCWASQQRDLMERDTNIKKGSRSRVRISAKGNILFHVKYFP